MKSPTYAEVWASCRTASVRWRTFIKAWAVWNGAAIIQGADDATIQAIAAKAKVGCPVSKLLKANVTMTATLATQQAPALTAIVGAAAYRHLYRRGRIVQIHGKKHRDAMRGNHGR